MRKMKNACNILAGKPAGREHSEDLGVDGNTKLEWILRKLGGKL
jgi:hypothetical protein